MKTNLMKSFAELESVVLASKQLVVEISAAAECCASCIVNGGTIFTCGNGGSAADAMHFAEELSGRYKNTRRALSGLCLIKCSKYQKFYGGKYGKTSIFGIHQKYRYHGSHRRR